MHETIHVGDDVLLYLDQKRTYLVKAEKGEVFHTHKGFIKFNELIGEYYGTQIVSSMGVRFVVLRPTIQDYIFKIRRRTQITYPKDVALIIMFSGVGPGSSIVEAGTGTGALTSALAFYVKPAGRVYSYDIRYDFMDTVLKNLRRAGVSEYVDLKTKDVTQGIDEKDVDAVILDLATPWLVIPHAYKALKGSGSLVSFSPTIDQIIKTVEVLKENQFLVLETIECFIRRMQTERGKTRPETMMTRHTGYITHARKVIIK